MSQKKYSSLDHAKHNHSLCDQVSKLENYPDWVVTLAFYSCLHYLRHKIFPFTKMVSGKRIKIKSFDNYCRVKGINGKKHSVMRSIVINKCPGNISNAYKRLLDLSYTARYKEYQTSPKLAGYSKLMLDVIEKYCKG